MSAAGDLLAELGVAERPEALGELLARFEARAPHEVAEDHPRDPERVIAELLAEGTGTIGAERTAAVAHLARALGHAPRVVSGEKRTREGVLPHAGLLFSLPGGDALCDPAFPLAGLVPVGAREVPSAWGGLDLLEREGRLVLAIEGRGRRTEAVVLERGGGRPFDVAAMPVPDPSTLVRLFEDRVVCWRRGVLEIRDRFSYYTQPLRDAEAIERTFGVPREGVAAADSASAHLSVFDRSALPADVLRARIATPEGLAALQPEGLELPGEAVFTPDGADVVTPERGLVARRSYRVEPTPEGTRLALHTDLRTIPPRGLPEPVRKTLVFHLVSELLAWEREPPAAKR